MRSRLAALTKESRSALDPGRSDAEASATSGDGFEFGVRAELRAEVESDAEAGVMGAATAGTEAVAAVAE